jgi:hypothetical protein
LSPYLDRFLAGHYGDKGRANSSAGRLIGKAFMKTVLLSGTVTRGFNALNNADYFIAKAIDGSLEAIGSQTSTDFSSFPVDEYREFRGLRAGEVMRNFDTHLTMSVDGWLDHHLQPHGYVLGVGTSRLNIGLGRVAIDGYSNVNLRAQGVERAALTGEGLVAVFDTRTDDGVVDTVRVVVPAESSCRAFVQQVIDELSLMTSFAPAIKYSEQSESHCYSTLRRRAAWLAQAIPVDTSYVADRLSAMTRMPSGERPEVRVVGVSLSRNVVLGVGISFDGGRDWCALFPLETCKQSLDAVLPLLQKAHQRYVEVSKPGGYS